MPVPFKTHTIGTIIEYTSGSGFCVQVDCSNGEAGASSATMLFDIGPIVDDDGGVTIGLFPGGHYKSASGMSSEPALVISGVERSGSESPGRLLYQITKKFESWCLFHDVLPVIAIDDLAKAIFDHVTMWITDAKKFSSASAWIEFMARLPLPCGLAVLADTRTIEEMTDKSASGLSPYEGMAVTRIRHLVLANGIGTKGIKRTDLIRGLLEHAAANPNEKSDAYNCAGLRCGHPDYRTSRMVIKGSEVAHLQWQESGDKTDSPDFYKIDQHALSLPELPTEDPPREKLGLAFCHSSSESTDPTADIYKVAAAIAEISPEQAAVLENAVNVTQGNNKRHARMVLEAEESEEKMRTESAAYKEQCESILSACRNSEAKKLPTGEGMVEIVGEQFPRFNFPSAPPAHWSPEAFVAREQMGRVGNNVEFTAADVADAILNNAVTSLVGPPGTGKTTVVQWIASTIQCPSHVVQFTRDKQVEDLFGCDKICNGSQSWHDGEITSFLRLASQNLDTPHIITFDEFDHADAAVQSTCQPIVEGRPLVLPNGESIEVNDNVHFVLTRNTTGHGDATGRHAAASLSDSAFNSRISVGFSVTYMAPSSETAVLAVHGLPMDECINVVNFAHATRVSVESGDNGDNYDSMGEPVCLRHLISYAKTRARGVAQDKAFASCILSSLPHSDRSVANELAIVHLGDGGAE